MSAAVASRRGLGTALMLSSGTVAIADPGGRGRVVWVGAAVWLALAIAVGASGLTRGLTPPWPQVILVSLTLALLAGFFARTPLRDWALGVDPRALVLVHVTRFVGFYFLVLYGRGELPWAFAVPGGLGDIAVAALALVLAATVNPAAPAGRRLLLAWNMFGLVDIAGVVLTASRLAIADPASMEALLRMPLSLLPTFLVPIIIATHVMLFVRLLRVRGRSLR